GRLLRALIDLRLPALGRHRADRVIALDHDVPSGEVRRESRAASRRLAGVVPLLPELRDGISDRFLSLRKQTDSTSDRQQRGEDEGERRTRRLNRRWNVDA